MSIDRCSAIINTHSRCLVVVVGDGLMKKKIRSFSVYDKFSAKELCITENDIIDDGIQANGFLSSQR